MQDIDSLDQVLLLAALGSPQLPRNCPLAHSVHWRSARSWRIPASRQMR